MRVIPDDLKILRLPAIDHPTTAVIPTNLQLRELGGLPHQLLLQGLDMVQVDMGITHGMNKGTGMQVHSMSNHMGQEGVGGNIERHAEGDVTRALVELAVEMTLLVLAIGVGDVELGEHMTRREGHLLEIGGVPGAHDDAAVEGVILQLVHDLGELVNALSRVVGFGVDVLGPEVAPLEPVHGTQIADLAVVQADLVEELTAAVAVPDLDALVGERQG